MKQKKKKLNAFEMFATPAPGERGGNTVKPTNAYTEFKKEDIYQSVPERFQQQVERFGDKVAVKTDDKRFTYDSLNRLSNRVAHSLLENYENSYRLNQNEKSRYSRQMMLHGWGVEAQEKLKRTTVFCAGAGGSGSPLIMQLALSGFGKIIICDFDEVELSNLNRQVLHDESRIDMNKARSAAKTVKRINPNVEVIAYDRKITRDTMCQMAQGADIVFDNVDDMEAKFIISQYCVDKQVPHIISSMIDMNCYAAVFHSPKTCCFHCINDRGILDEVAEIKKLVSDYKKNPNPVSSPALFLCTGFAVNEAIKIVLGLDAQKPAYDKYFFFNQRGAENIAHSDAYRLITYAYNRHFRDLAKEQGCDWDEGWKGGFMDEINLRKDHNCPACGKDAALDPLPETCGDEALTALNLENEPEFMAVAKEEDKEIDVTDSFHLQTVALLFQHGADMIAGIMGILKSGKVYVPLDPGYPEERLDYMLEDSGSRLIVTNDLNYQFACKLRDGVNKNIRIINVDNLERDALEGKLNPAWEENPDVEITHQDIAYVLYTSGSTGKPKGVMQSHRNVLHFGRVYTNALHLNENDRISLFSTYGFDAAKMDIYGALLNGGTLYPYDIKLEDNLSRMGRWLQEEGITIYHSIPTVYRYFTDTLTGEADMSAVRFIVLGGEAVFKRDIEAYKEHFSDECLFINGLGPTESTVTIQFFMDKNTPISREAVPVGFAVDETQVLLLDENDREAVGASVGEIVYKSDYLALGYLNNPVKSKEVFIPNPLTGKDRVYRSGDLGRRLLDGTLEYAGRKDFQVKIRGYRVELGEIEGRLDNVAGIKKSAVVCKQDQDGENYLTAYYVLSETGGVTAQVDEMQLVSHLQEAVPDYMIPGAFYHLDQFPLTATGKIDRKALTEMAETQVASEKEYVAPSGPIETKLETLWQDLLGVEKIGVHDNFFVLGGHSLKATILVSRIHKTFDVRISLPDIFKLRTIQAIAQFIQEANRETHVGLEKAPVTEFYPLSAAQKRMYVVHQLDDSGTGYNMHTVVEIEGNLDIERLTSSFKEMINRHDSFRTSFHLLEEEAVQKVHDAVDFEIERIDLTGAEAGAGDVEKAISQFIRPFDLAAAPLLRVGLMEKGEGQYVLLMDMDHIIADGTSIVLFVREFFALYGEKQLEPLNFQYKDYCYWRSLEAQQEAIKKQETYWLEKYAGEIPVLDLPNDFIRPAIQSFDGRTFDFSITAPQAEALNSLAREEGATLYIVLLAVINTWLSKLTGQEDIIVGTPTAGRGHADLERVIGMFVNTLALRNGPARDLPFREFLGQVKESTLEAFENQDYQFEDIVEKVGVRRDTSRNPLFDVMFMLRNFNITSTDIPAVQLEGLQFKPYSHKRETAKFDLDIVATERTNGILFTVEYAAKLFKESTMERFAAIFQSVVSALVQDFSITSSRIDVISQEEREIIVNKFNKTETDYPADTLIHGLFQDQVRRTPEAAAVIGGGYGTWNVEEKGMGKAYPELDNRPMTGLTYIELNRCAETLARQLREKGVSVGDVAAIMVPASLEMLVGILGILKAGAAWLPISPAFPEERIRYILKDSNAACLVTVTPHLELIENAMDEGLAGCHVLDIQDMPVPADSDDLAGETDVPRACADNAAYIIYTSGSTGTPKGVVVPHKAFVNRLYFLQEQYGFREGDVVLQKTAPTFDVSVCELLRALPWGGAVALPGGDVERDMDYMVQVIEALGITVLDFVPSMLNLFLDYIQSHKIVETMSGLRFVFVGVEAVELQIVERFRKLLNKPFGTRLLNAYGPTEASVDVTWYDCTAAGETLPQRIPIGKPIANTQIHILDNAGLIQPIGIKGQLCISGRPLAHGYLNRPELTAETFTASSPSSPLLYRTGDLARWDEEGNIQFFGRIDFQVKIRGFRVEPGEIQEQLNHHESLREAVVLARAGVNGDNYLCAYVVPAEPDSFDQTAGIQELRLYLAGKLPEYMVPSFIIPLDEIPLTANGKLDKKALPEPDAEAGAHYAYAAATDEIEEKLVSLWSSVLGMEADRIGIDTPFFELGGHSLKATILVSRIHKSLGVKMPLAEVFRLHTVRAMAQYLKGAQKSQFIDVEANEKKEYYPLSYNQKRLWVVDQANPGDTSFNMPGSIGLGHEADVEAIRKTLAAITRRHHSFRTCFAVVGGSDQPVQMIAETVDIPLEIVDISNMEREEKRKWKREMMIKERSTPFDLTRAPLFRATLVKIEEKHWDFIYNMHHIITDGWSQELLTRDFGLFYESYRTGKTPGLEPLPVQYSDYAVWNNRQINDPLLKEKATVSWKERIEDGIPQFRLLHDFSGDSYDYTGISYRVALDEEVKEGLKTLAVENNTTLFMVLFGVFNWVIGGYAGSNRVVSSIISAGRDHVALQDIVGFFINSVVAVCDVDFEEAFEDFLQRLDKEVMELLRYQAYPLELVLEGLKMPYPDVTVSFNMLNIQEDSTETELASFQSNHTENNWNSKFDLALHVVEYKNGLELRWVYRKAFFEPDTVETIANEFQGLVEALTESEEE